MFRSQSNLVRQRQSPHTPWIKHISLAIVWITIGVGIDQKLIESSTTQNHSVLALSKNDPKASQGANKPKLNKIKLSSSDSQLKECEQEREDLHIRLNDFKSRLELYDDTSQMHAFLNTLRVTEFTLAELKHSFVKKSSQTQACLLARTEQVIQPGDLVVSQGALIGEIAKVDKDCFEIIPVESDQSSFEVVLEKSGVRGIAVGLGSKSIKLDSNKYEEATIKLKYLERSASAIIGERALLIRKYQSSDQANFSVQMHPRLSPLTVGEVVQATIDENGLFQSALLASSLYRSSVSLVAIISIPTSTNRNSWLTDQ